MKNSNLMYNVSNIAYFVRIVALIWNFLTEKIDAISLLVSFMFGTVSSYIVWWLTSHYWVPRIIFSPEIAEYIIDDSDVIFLVSFENDGRRDIVDLEVLVRIGVRNFMDATGVAYHVLKSNASRIPRLSPGRTRRVRVFDTRDPVQFLDVPSRPIRTAMEGCRSLKDILRLGSGGTIEIHVFGYDAFTGVRKHFQSRKYGLYDIRKGTFHGLNVVENTRFNNRS